MLKICAQPTGAARRARNTLQLQYSSLPAVTGAHDRNRTGDLVLTKDVLYRLSYMGLTSSSASDRSTTLERVVGIEPTSSAWKAEVLPLNYTRATRAADGADLPAALR
jgi:hypothetical protein